MKLWSFALVVLLTACSSVSARRFACYYGSWSVYRQGPGHYTVEDIDPTLCTHLIYSFIGLSYEGEVKLLDAYNDIGDEWHEGAFFKLQKLKASHPDVKIMLAVGGWNHGPANFQEVVKKPEKRQLFINTAIAMLDQYGFDGLDIDWEYQDAVGGSEEDRRGFSDLLREMYAAFKAKGFVLSTATSANFNLIEVCYELDVMSQNVDFINVMNYDLHGSWEKHTGHVSPLHALSSETGDDRHLNVEAVINKYLERGADPAKINIGLVAYGRTFTLADVNQHDINSPACCAGQPGENYNEAGSYAYGEYCLKASQGLWQSYWNDEQAVPYGVHGDQWIGYDDPRSLVEKLNFAKSKGLGGAMIWSIETDDFLGQCGSGKYPILRTINDNLPA